MLGIVAAAVTIGIIVLRLVEAMAPVATPLSLRNASALPMTLERVQIDGQVVSQLPQILAPGQSLATPAGRALPPIALRVARPALVEVVASSTSTGTLACTFEPRPHGSCSARVQIRSLTELACEFECTVPASAPTP